MEDHQPLVSKVQGGAPWRRTVGGSLLGKPGLLLKKIWGEGRIMQGCCHSPCPSESQTTTLRFSCKCPGIQSVWTQRVELVFQSGLARGWFL